MTNFKSNVAKVDLKTSYSEGVDGSSRCVFWWDDVAGNVVRVETRKQGNIDGRCGDGNARDFPVAMVYPGHIADTELRLRWLDL